MTNLLSFLLAYTVAVVGTVIYFHKNFVTQDDLKKDHCITKTHAQVLWKIHLKDKLLNEAGALDPNDPASEKILEEKNREVKNIITSYEKLLSDLEIEKGCL